MTARFCSILAFLLASGWSGYAQEIEFGKYGPYQFSDVQVANQEGLHFGQVITESGFYEKDISNNIPRVELTGVKYLDAYVYITTTGGCGSYPMSDLNFQLKAAYDNTGGSRLISEAKFLPVSSNNEYIFEFPILERKSLPPGPPPPPPTNAFEQSKVEETAYIYLFGNIDVGDVAAGTYCSEINVEISYVSYDN
ncbi:hypothetical protein ACG2F4_06225 [Halalkalibaculum sp. DA3122]|uniref:hypothetical protein n=1 Tax=unclassified Halalkalibaculum TaxID=2964617 RepID=UPI003754B5E5